MANSSATPSQMIVLTSRNNSPQNLSHCEGKQQKLLVVSHSEPMGGGGRLSRSTTALKGKFKRKRSKWINLNFFKDEFDLDTQSPLSKLSPQNSPPNLEQQSQQTQSQFPFSLAKRFLSNNSKAKGPLKKLECEKRKFRNGKYENNLFQLNH
jgi:hypothetical protein